MQNRIEILIVEDSSVQAQKLRYFLEKEGYQVSVASDGIEALSFLEKRKPSLVISDIMMPKMNGYELCQHIRADKTLRDLPVILLTTLSDPADVLEALKCEADNFITKPYSNPFILTRIKHILLNQELLKKAKTKEKSELYFLDEKHMISSSHTRILNLLLSIYENATQKNRELEQVNHELAKAQFELKAFNEQLEKKVGERTQKLTNEIAERMQAEQDLKKHREHLEERVRERTEKLQTVVNAMAGREIRMAELKEVINKLIAQIDSAGLTPVADDPIRET